MTRRNLTITANDQRIARVAREMQSPLERWLAKATERFATDEIRRMKSRRSKKVKLAKAASQAELERELRRILVTFGVRSVDASGRDMATRLDGDWVVSPSLIQTITRQKQARVTGIMNQTLLNIRGQVRKIMLTASKESPRPSIAELARRIRVNVVELPPLKGDKNPELIARANRAELIARTESAQNENTGIVEGMAAAGVSEIEWLAHTDGRSGKRQHNKMNGRRIPLADSRGSDRSKWFRMPDGARMRYPGDPSGPIRHTARCRCTSLPVIRKGSRKLSPGTAKPKVRDGSR